MPGTSNFLKNSSVEFNDTLVSIECEFIDNIEGASCVLVYREKSNQTLTVKEYPQDTDFPVTVTVDYPENYTFAIFGKQGSIIDQTPGMTVLATDIISPIPTSGIYIYIYGTLFSSFCIAHRLRKSL